MDRIITELGVFDIVEGQVTHVYTAINMHCMVISVGCHGYFGVGCAIQGVVMREMAAGVTVEEVQAKTGCTVHLCPDLKEMEFA